MPTPARPPRPPRLPGALRRSAAPVLLALAGGLVAGWLLNLVLEDAIERRSETGVLALLARAGPDVESVLASGQDPRETIERLGRQLSLRATLIDRDGRVLGDSDVQRDRIASLENHASRPEVRDAMRNGTGLVRRYSATLADRLVYAAARLRDGQVLRLAFPERELSEWEAPFRRQTVGLSVLAGLLVAALLVRTRSRHAAELELVREAVGDASRGERPGNPGDVSEETARVFSALGDLADLATEKDAGARRDAALARAVFDGVPDGLVVVDGRLSLLHANAEAVRLLGADAAALRPGEHVLELLREKAFAALLEEALSAGRAAVTLRIPASLGGRTLRADGVRVAGGGRPGEPAALAILREVPSPPPD